MVVKRPPQVLIINPYGEYADLHRDSDDKTKANIEATVASYNKLTTDAAKMNAQSKNLMNAVNYGYSYVTLQGIYKNLDEKNCRL
mgnify:CR=1 FL=1